MKRPASPTVTHHPSTKRSWPLPLPGANSGSDLPPASSHTHAYPPSLCCAWDPLQVPVGTPISLVQAGAITQQPYPPNQNQLSPSGVRLGWGAGSGASHPPLTPCSRKCCSSQSSLFLAQCGALPMVHLISSPPSPIDIAFPMLDSLAASLGRCSALPCVLIGPCFAAQGSD